MFTESNCSIIAMLKNKVSKTAQAQHDGEYDHLLDNNIQLSSDESSQEMSTVTVVISCILKYKKRAVFF